MRYVPFVPFSRNNSVRARCHPERAHAAKGLCVQCYKRSLPSWRAYKSGQKVRRRRWLRANSAEYRAKEQQRQRRRKFGLTAAEQTQLLELQRAACAVCRTPLGERSHLDHCHETGVVRGFLCHGCNIGIGHLRNDPARLRAAALYVESPPGAVFGVRVRPTRT